MLRRPQHLGGGALAGESRPLEDAAQVQPPHASSSVR